VNKYYHPGNNCYNLIKHKRQRRGHEKNHDRGDEPALPLPPRNTSTLDSALLGHWRDKAGNELYFSPDTVTFVPAATGEEYASGYTIISRDDVLKSMKLEFSEPGEIFAAAYPDSDQYPSVFFRKPGLDGLIFGAIFFSLKARNGMSLSETEYPFIDTRQQP
jgi:hypothetical protein